MENKLINHLFNLCDLSGVPGQEQQVVDYLKQHLHQNQCEYDGLGSFLCNKGHGPLSIMMAVHMDEVGYIVKEITDEGFVRVQPAGFMWPHVVLAQEFLIENKHGENIAAIMGSKASHGLTPQERKEVVDYEDLYLDLGLQSKEELTALGIEVGCQVVPSMKSRYFNDENHILAKAIDNRVGVALGLSVLEDLTEDHHNKVTLAATVQEEVGLRGARTTADLVYPDLAIAIDTTLAGDTPLDNNNVKLGQGVTISVMDSMTVVNRGLLVYLEALCERENIDYQLSCFVAGGTDAGNIHKSREGIPSIVLSVPVRYMHTHRTLAHKHDIIETYRLCMAIINDLNQEKYNEILDNNFYFSEGSF